MTLEDWYWRPIVIALSIALLSWLLRGAWKRLTALFVTVRKVDEALPKLVQMAAELQPNGGGSVRDKIDGIVRKLEFQAAARRTLADVSTPIAFYECDAAGRCTYVSQRWTEITGLSNAEAEGFGWLGGIHRDDREAVEKEWKAAVEQKREFDLAYRMVDRHGNETRVHGQARMFRDDAGRYIGALGYNSVFD